MKRPPPLQSLSAAPRRFLWIGIGASLAVHASLLALQFSAPPPPARTPPISLEVVLLNLQSDSVPEHPSALAQTASAGGGEHDAGVATSPLPAWTGASQLPHPTTNSANTTPTERRLLTQSHSELRLDPGQEGMETRSIEPSPTEATDLGDTPELIAQLHQQYAVLSQKLQQASRQPRQHFFAPSTSPWIFAEYVERWRAHVEATGNRHYPPQLRGRYYGSLQLTVVIRSDGSLAKVDIDRPSIHPEINEAALAIVQRAAPFPPFPDNIRGETDMLSVTRTWYFENDALSTQTP